MDAWVITGKSESGSKFGPEVYMHKPTKKELKSLANWWKVGCNSTVHLKVKKENVR